MTPGGKAYIQGVETKEIVDPAFHQKLAMLCEDLGIISRAVLEYNLSLRGQPNQIPILKRLAVIYRDQGQADKAIRLWQQVVPCAPELEGLT